MASVVVVVKLAYAHLYILFAQNAAFWVQIFKNFPG